MAVGFRAFLSLSASALAKAIATLSQAFQVSRLSRVVGRGFEDLRALGQWPAPGHLQTLSQAVQRKGTPVPAEVSVPGWE